MFVKLQQFWTIARNSALEIIRDPIYVILLTVTFGLIGFLPVVSAYALGGQQKFVHDSSLAALWVIGLMAAAFGASNAVTREIQGGTALAVLSKPVDRSLFILAKFVGLCLALAVLTFSGTVAALASSRMAAKDFHIDPVVAWPYYLTIVAGYLLAAFGNYFLKRQFQQDAVWLTVLLFVVGFAVVNFFDAAGKPHKYGDLVNWQLVPACALIFLALMMTASLTIALSTRLDAIPTLTLGVGIFLIGLMSDYLFGRHADENLLWATVYGIIPNWQHFWMADALSAKTPIPWAYVLGAARYAFLYLAAFLAFGLFLFEERELG
ncbi:MAG: hypothetical protein COZ06_02085 [Armatimonadetes bacterium CG_4_10_14_3_um_filter_66_18]|nr:hypothetical protein [Armatimonadota bacterium]OIO95215.1 MAG: hypothetical protein AUJ96_27210 [Armatimonadetes bacterium CG2_30_66_41]PIU89686.1 MAG: hypothetical protein COS65_27945 [Armatimonadetes bacterium CG06_land_8_20_14_3_00_66_21]PIX49567.1 MAG: hypothetical protein COZ57_03135 [Armatimonadetes bacterium CG_4_8_14_3_um_filter_66_20]PIY53153.1 MAG: hypothetical protein COZ06_02085 [Armatimonadetes bacterium CG_4_10_14_3_um_filter_66_18]PIZ50165.1 MAG: hypothetical protein COY42_02